jgi:cyclic beta-1,2-glucan synthetase
MEDENLFMTNHPSDPVAVEEQAALPQEHVINELEQKAQQLAKSHQLQRQPGGDYRLLDRLAEQEKRLTAAYQQFRHSSDEELSLSYAAEWLLDNFYVVQQTLRQIEEDLPRGYYRQLPRLDASSPLAGLPRIYAIAHELVLHDQCRLDPQRIEQFVTTYQTIAPLTMGEVWALPSLLRFAILESLAQAVSNLTGLNAASKTATPRLQFMPEVSDTDIVAACIPALRALATQDWKMFFEQVSLVEQALQRDPTGLYKRMDFETRNQYRTAIEDLARAAAQNEVDVAHTAIRLAQADSTPRSPVPLSPDNGPEEETWLGLNLPRTSHVGYYLIDAGRRQLEASFAYRPTGLEVLRRGMLDHPTLFYLSSIGLISLLVLVGVMSYAFSHQGTTLQLVVVGLVTLIPAITMGVNLVNWFVTKILPPRVLPKLDFQHGIPARCRTAVVIPALLAHPADLVALFSELELHYLRNPDANLIFALLTDFADAPQEHMPEDDALIAQAQVGLEELNRRYAHQPFYFFHRRRLWNPKENVWMGWERKRGKLHEFNQLLRGNPETSYIVRLGDLAWLPTIHYVITLDADTILPGDGARRLAATLAHPLNRARLNPTTGQVSAGYTILQPRPEIKPVSANQSLFTRVFAGDTGLDLYTHAVSDVYQDLFGEGIYVGKGIYDVDAFEASLHNRVPENALLSHDLFEGLHSRVGLVTDVTVYEDYPPHYLVHIQRVHRWIRGDWQLLPWLLPWVPSAEGRKIRSSLSLIDWWKIADNLRRSLLAPALLLFFLAGWLWLPGSPLVWTLLGLLTPAWPFISQSAAALIRLPFGASGPEVRRVLRDSAIRWLLALAFLPYEAILALDAILVTLTRLWLTRRKLLQWRTAASATQLFGQEIKLQVTKRQMTSAVLISGTLALLVYLIRPAALPVAFPLLVAWLLSPEIAFWISRPTVIQQAQLTAAQRRQLRILARRTWLFFEQFAGPQDNWLPPDHFQESPLGVVAHRTSPTNIGLFLLSTLAAHDLGYLDPVELSLRLTSTLDTLARLDKHRGHFLNWLDTQTLEPLPPRYISTVDSGNLAACLLALKHACLSISQQPVWPWERWQAFLDTLALLAELVDGLEAKDQAFTAIREHLLVMQQTIEAGRDHPQQWASLLSHLLSEVLPRLDHLLVEWVEAEGHQMGAEWLRNLRRYSERARHHLSSLQRQLDQLLPWLQVLHQPPALFAQANLEPALVAAWQSLLDTFSTMPTLAEAGDLYSQAREQLAGLQTLLQAEEEPVPLARIWCEDLKLALNTAETRIHDLLEVYAQIAEEAEAYFQGMDFSFLFNQHRQIFHIGYNLDTGKLDNNYYDLLASEARIASILAIAKNDVPQSHWLHLARPLTNLAHGQTLLSWSGTMFEYLMPVLLMRSYTGTLLDQSVQAAAAYQIDYGRQKKVPWGISESGYYAFDPALNYQYRAFGAPALGFKRGLAEDLVITPYASLLALPLQPQAVIDNLDHLTRSGMLGHYGFYEALDYTPTRLVVDQDHAIVASYMAHHQGMILLALVNYLEEEIMVRRFHADPRVQGVELLLQERIPFEAPIEKLPETDVSAVRPDQAVAPLTPWEVPPTPPMPQVHYLSNKRYQLLLTSSGGSYSQWQGVSLTRWRADTTLDNWGSWLYVQDEEAGAPWSATYQPTTTSPEYQRVIFHPHMVEFHRRDRDIALGMEVIIAPDDDVEIRVVTLSNTTDRPRQLRLTTYGEVVLAPQGADERHQAFAKLFVQSEYLPEYNSLLFRRRPRSADEQSVFLMHRLIMEPDHPLTGAYESSRVQFLGRGRTPQSPLALENGPWLSGTTGATLDPIFSLGQTISLEPHASARLVILTLAAETRPVALDLAGRYQSWSVIEQTFNQARTRAEQRLRQLGFDAPLLQQTQQLLSLLLYPHRARRAEPALLTTNQKGQSGLWGFAISGDYPILLVRLQQEEELSLVQDLLKAHAYWRNRHLKIDLVILNEKESGYNQLLQGELFRLIHQMNADNWLNQRGGIFLLRADQLNEGDLILLQTAARVIVDADKGTLAQQISGLYEPITHLPDHMPVLSPTEAVEPVPPLAQPTDLLFNNGRGGFRPDGSEYVIYLKPGENTPAPWINVIANPDFGFLVSETGGGYTWAVNSGENRLSPWRNDPVSDLPGEALYLRDEETAEVWSPTPQPAPADAPYLARHGAGYTIFEHHSHGLQHHLCLFAAPDAPLKVVQLRIENMGQRPRRITATYYLEWVLGVNRENSQAFIIPEYDEGRRALLVRNPYNAEFGQRVAFVGANKVLHGLTTDRTEFLGRLGNLRSPAGLRRIGLEGRVGAGFDPCAALQLHLDLPPGGSEEIYFLVGQGADRTETQALLDRYQDAEQVAVIWQAVQELWENILGTVRVNTPDTAMNLLLNRWLLYQTLSCRIWGRSALYQSSGAFGFRDQLQDVMALLHSRPDLTREQILRAARHQFTIGDVLHWWHPPSGRGVRTLIKDDLVWLPYVTTQYIAATGDEAILFEEVPFLKGAPLKEGEEERYGLYESTEETATLYEHCRRVFKKSEARGPHNLPLMGAGDWNDGMNKVGIGGQGESVWLGWFLHTSLTRFAELCEKIDDPGQAAIYRQQAGQLRDALESSAWDGDWYRRAYYDDGTPLGSAQNKECQIDSIAQSWGVLSKAADPQRAKQAMGAVLERLVQWDERLILLFTPPFDKTSRDPGYIKGYLPGVRENGGQYTHAALWTIWAMAELGDGDTAEALFRLINPIYRADTPEKAAQYQVEPYVISADVYSVSPHTSRGGWTWYTGSSGWMYRLGIEAILGLHRQGQILSLDPHLPKEWPGYRATYRYGQTTYEIEVKNPNGVSQGVKQVMLDNHSLPDGHIPLQDDGQHHQVEVSLGE